VSVALALMTLAAMQGAVPVSSDAMKSESRLALAAYADCLVARKGEAVRTMLSKPYDDRVSKESRGLNDDACPFATATTVFDQRLVRKLDGLQLRSVLYQALILRDPARVQTVASIPAADAFPIGRNWPGSPAMNYLRYIAGGRCTIDRDPEHARRLVQSPIRSAAEDDALATLAPTLTKCGWRGDERLMVRGAVAEIYYRATDARGAGNA
jgi:hypothetical protein